jgi:hypothetical protein
LVMMAPPLTAEAPAAIKVAPPTPPMRACEELDGMPKYRVSRFQASPAKKTVKVIAPVSTMPVAMVAATWSDRKAPAKLSPADRATASFGRSAPVAMEGAMAVAVSRNPLVRSNDSAVAMTTASNTVFGPITHLWGAERIANRPSAFVS